MSVSVRRPSERTLLQFLERQEEAGFSYPEVGASRGEAPTGYAVDLNRVPIGSGRSIFEEACRALTRWEMFNIGWAHVYPAETPIAEGKTVVVVAKAMGLWFLNACRIVYVQREVGPIERFGFAYGTLMGHAERGEERFTVEWDRASGAVCYEQFAFSRPKAIVARLAYPLSRATQGRFARDALATMKHAVTSIGQRQLK